MKFKNGDMDQILLNFLAKYIQLSEEEKNAIIDVAFFTSFKKGTILLKEGQLSKDSYFVVKGCIRCYYIVDGEEKTTAFYSDGESLTPPSALTRKPSEYYISCLEDSVLSAGDAEPDEELFKKFPKLEKLCRILSEDLHSKSQIAFDNFKISSPEQRYLHLLETRPDLVQRIPQYYLASYLGITPQSLSRMRNRLVKKVS
ncbi:Crp/Fnr family transcriptional regulator [Pedobacter africanus]|uniref:cAMP-binding domain of CRP or a regulatory subunit of cAMP-dependent protein kinases n=1 Tax=Pedobacter africanus TaxID=151894 RepID=A0A1W2AZC7_9SPHI|nr:Crp/Fnr family transcriptional regulator [Pedobacter africanus]SMC65890.1 cAMP-binding domain of CRP or a regulatory subunit of cAMP-dependent protein kinases [Pedobacter africanus]